MENEKLIKPAVGYLYLFLILGLLGLSIFSITLKYSFGSAAVVVGVIGILVSLTLMGGFFIVNPNESMVLLLFGTYKGSVKNYGFYWANPFLVKKKISLRARNLNGEKLKVNDAVGNPIEIAAVIVWQVEDTAKAAFEVDDYVRFVEIQSEAAVRNLAGAYPYDNHEVADAKLTLRAGAELVNEVLEKELNERLTRAGIHVLEARISHLAYASEIASAMLQRQQAQAVVAARQTIVEGAVGMVEMALEMLEKNQTVKLDEERKAAMVSNLLVVLCSDRAVSPVVNTGTLHH